MASGRKPGPQCSYIDPVNIADGTMCLAVSPVPGPLGASATVSRNGDGKPVPQMTHAEKMEEAIRRAHNKGQISDEVIKQLPSIQELVIGIVVVGAVLVGLGVTAGLVASTGVGAILEGIAAAIVLALAAIGVVASAGQIIAGIKMLMKFYLATQKAMTSEDVDEAGKNFAIGLAAAGAGTVMMIISVIGGRQGLKMGKGAIGRWNAAEIVAERPVPPKTAPRQEPASIVSVSEQSVKSREALGRAATAQDQLSPKSTYADKTVGSDGDKTLSGWKPENLPAGYKSADTKEVAALSKKIGHELRPSMKDNLVRSDGTADPDGFPGRYYASHAEKQLAVTNPNEPIAVTKPMCKDCFSFFQKLASSRDASQIITDPDCTRVFWPDGRVTLPDGSPAPPALRW